MRLETNTKNMKIAGISVGDPKEKRCVIEIPVQISYFITENGKATTGHQNGVLKIKKLTKKQILKEAYDSNKKSSL